MVSKILKKTERTIEGECGVKELLVEKPSGLVEELERGDDLPVVSLTELLGQRLDDGLGPGDVRRLGRPLGFAKAARVVEALSGG